MNLKNAGWIALLLCIITLPLLAHLDDLPLFEWDEARLANTALEMYYHHDWIVPHYLDAPDMWSTKPPLMIWTQVLMMRLVGVNDLAVRLPSALCALLTCVLLFWFAAAKLKKPRVGILIAAVLVTTKGYVTLHGTRTGDYDSMLALMMTAYCLMYFLYLEEWKNKYLLWACLFIVLAALTKGIQGMIMLPALALYTLYKNKVLTVLRRPQLYAGMAGAALVIVGYYLLREHYNHGYLRAVWENELGGRYATTLEGHWGGRWWYLDYATKEGCYWWWPLAICGLLMVPFYKDKVDKDTVVFSAIVVTSYVFILSNAQTKLTWYLMPAYPFMAILAGLFLNRMAEKLTGPIPGGVKGNVLASILFVAVFAIPYKNMLEYCMSPTPGDIELIHYRYSCFYRDLLKSDMPTTNLYLMNYNDRQHYNWYRRAIEYGGRKLNMIDTTFALKPGMEVIPCIPEARQYVEVNFDYTLNRRFRDEPMYRIVARKPVMSDTISAHND